jgi:curved DNA-binding protein CbpA
LSDAPEPIAQGSLAQTPFAHVLLYCMQNRLTGTLVVWPEGSAPDAKQDRILFTQGSPVAARLAQPAAALDRGLLPLFTRRDAPYAFYDADVVTGATGVITGQVDPLALLAASLRGPSREDAIEHVLARLVGVRLRLKPGADLRRFGFDSREQPFIDVLRAGPATLAELCGTLPDQKLAKRLSYLLTITKVVEPYEEPAPGASTSLEPPPPVTSVAPSAPSVDADRVSAPPKRGLLETPPSFRRAGEPAPPPEVPADLSPEHKAAWKEIADRFKRIHEENFFVMLGVPRDCGVQAVRDAYFELAKKWHPDRLAPELIELKPYQERIFHWLTQARDTLGDDDKRGKYIGQVSEGGGTPAADQKVSDIITAAMEFQKAEVLARRSNWSGAVDFLERALALNPEESDFHALRGWLLFQMYSGPNAPVDRMLAAVDTALKLNDRSERAHYYKGMILKRLNRGKEALTHFRKAAELNPRNTDAAREVRLAAMRGDSPAGGASTPPKKPGSDPAKPDKGGSSVFGKLFGGSSDKKKK